jgi:hypothetical protein
MSVYLSTRIAREPMERARYFVSYDSMSHGKQIPSKPRHSNGLALGYTRSMRCRDEVTLQPKLTTTSNGNTPQTMTYNTVPGTYFMSEIS